MKLMSNTSASEHLGNRSHRRIWTMTLVVAIILVLCIPGTAAYAKVPSLEDRIAFRLALVDQYQKMIDHDFLRMRVVGSDDIETVGADDYGTRHEVNFCIDISQHFRAIFLLGWSNSVKMTRKTDMTKMGELLHPPLAVSARFETGLTPEVRDMLGVEAIHTLTGVSYCFEAVLYNRVLQGIPRPVEKDAARKAIKSKDMAKYDRLFHEWLDTYDSVCYRTEYPAILQNLIDEGAVPYGYRHDPDLFERERSNLQWLRYVDPRFTELPWCVDYFQEWMGRVTSSEGDSNQDENEGESSSPRFVRGLSDHAQQYVSHLVDRRDGPDSPMNITLAANQHASLYSGVVSRGTQVDTASDSLLGLIDYIEYGQFASDFVSNPFEAVSRLTGFVDHIGILGNLPERVIARTVSLVTRPLQICDLAAAESSGGSQRPLDWLIPEVVSELIGSSCDFLSGLGIPTSIDGYLSDLESELAGVKGLTDDLDEFNDVASTGAVWLPVLASKFSSLKSVELVDGDSIDISTQIKQSFDEVRNFIEAKLEQF